MSFHSKTGQVRRSEQMWRVSAERDFHQMVGWIGPGDMFVVIKPTVEGNEGNVLFPTSFTKILTPDGVVGMVQARSVIFGSTVVP